MGKARSAKSVGFFGDAVNFIQDTASKAADSVFKAITPDKGSTIDKLGKRRHYMDEAIEGKQKPTTKQKPKTTKQSKNKQLAADEKRSQGLSKAQVEEIRSRLKKGETVKTEEY